MGVVVLSCQLAAMMPVWGEAEAVHFVDCTSDTQFAEIALVVMCGVVAPASHTHAHTRHAVLLLCDLDLNVVNFMRPVVARSSRSSVRTEEQQHIMNALWYVCGMGDSARPVGGPRT